MHDDIQQKGDATAPYVVCGFFTENYRPLAERLAANLGPDTPYHLFAREKGDATWRQIVRWKPEIVLGAMDRYPGKSIIFLDMDSHIRGSLAPMVDFVGDISARAKLRLTGWPRPFRKKTVLHVTTRSMVLKPNDRVRKFLEDWKTEMRDATYYQGGCEMAMRIVLMRSVGLAFCPMDPRYAGIEVDEAPPGSVVVHESASRVQGRA